MVSDDLIIIGKFGSAHGINGFVKIHSFTEPADNILNYQPWLVKQGKNWVSKTFDKVEKRNKFYIAKMEDCQDRNDAEKYVNCEIATHKDHLPKLNESEFYWHELIDMTVINKEQITLGKVTQVLQTGSNDVLIIDGEKRHLIPFLLENFIIKIDRKKSEITVDWDIDF